MAGDNLTIDLAPSLREALAIPDATSLIDYYVLMGLPRGAATAEAIDAAVMARTKALRPWQNSADYGPEVVKLLPMLHRVATILKDPVRSEAYREQLDRLVSGEKADPREEFTDMVRAAMVGGSIDQSSRTELLKFATESEISRDEAATIVKEIGTELQDEPEAKAVDPNWEFRLAGEGADAFRSLVIGLMAEGQFDEASAEKHIGEAEKFSLDADQAREVIEELRVGQFRRMVLRVARNGVITNNQARLLMPKAAGCGISSETAYDILSNFTFTGVSQADLSQTTLVTRSFDDSEIDHLLTDQKTVVFTARSGLKSSLSKMVPPWLSQVTLAALAVVAVGVAGVIVMQNVPGGGDDLAPVGAPAPAVIAADAPSVTPSPTPTPNMPVDPQSGYLLIKPVAPEDPPAFEIKITEVTQGEYREFMRDMIYSAPQDWPGNLTAQQERAPVTGVTVKDAREFCRWVARNRRLRGQQASRVHLLRLDQYERMMRAPLAGNRRVGGRENFWGSMRYRKPGSFPPRANRNDWLYPDGPAGQVVYDLIANVAEWGEDARNDGRQIILGGDFAVTDERFDPLVPRYEDPVVVSPRVGFRVVIDAN